MLFRSPGQEPPESTQEPSRSTQGAFKSPKELPRAPKEHPRAPQGTFFCTLCAYHSMQFRFSRSQWEPKTPLGAPKILQVYPRTPKEPPRTPKEPPRSSQGAPKSSQGTPKSVQGAPKSSKEHPRSPQEAPKEQQVPIAMLSSDFSFELALLKVSSDSALPTFLFRFSSSEFLFRLSLRLPPLRFWLLTFNFGLLIALLFMFFFRQAFAVLYKSLFCISLLIFLPTFLFCLSLRELVFATWSLRFCMLRDGGGWDSSVADLIAALVPLMDPKP